MDSELTYDEKGAGRTVVLLHGFLEDSTMWDDILVLFKHYHLIKIDLPGHGRFVSEKESYSMSYMANKVLETLGILNVKNPIIIGHSMGGYVGLELMKLIKIERLILFNSNFWSDSKEKIVNRNRLIDVVQKNKDLFLKEAIQNLFYIKSNNVDFVISRLIENAKKIDSKEIIKTTRGLRDRQDNSALVSQNSSIIHVVQAENDPIIPLNDMHKAIKDLKNKPEFYIIKNSGHMSIWENRKATIEVLAKIILP
jgi:pimeloyl-ACP methyl ester carboxylesterase